MEPVFISMYLGSTVEVKDVGGFDFGYVAFVTLMIKERAVLDLSLYHYMASLNELTR